MFAARTATVGVVGIGYVGLPLAVEKAKVGFHVIGYDRNDERVAKVNRGDNYILDVVDAELSETVSSGALTASTDFSSLDQCDVIVICVPTPLTANQDPDISFIRNVGAKIAERLRPGQLVCLESTTYPGTTEEVLLPLFSAGDLVVGRDFFLAFSPERVDPGNKRYTTKNTNKLVGGVTPACTEVASSFYAQTILTVLPVASPKIAEMAKVFENTFRAVNIALVNELALLCDRMDINIWDVIDAAATKPFGIMRFEPGPGVGGHCIPVDPFYLTWKAREYDFHTRFIELAGEINLQMPYFVRDKIVRALGEHRKSLRGAKLLVLGVAYKKDIEDWRESPALKVIELLEHDGAAVVYHDPFIPSYRAKDGSLRRSVQLNAGRLRDADCVVILTDHSTIDWQEVVREARAVVDTRNATRNVRDEGSRVTLL
ncbi:MAG TPA: nucleotide sugar dehydrogenase [Candidatus Dormibacteraeota bacterium]|nr:nucleotide sugar dehydrogenase [Candidatus Dormibacteraeota bacterium]